MATSQTGNARARDEHVGSAPADPLAVFSALFLLALELLVAAAFNAGKISLIAGIELHAGIVAIAVLTIVGATRRKVDTGPAVLLAVATAVTGPLGALGCVMTGRLVLLGRESPDLLKAWYKRISMSTETDPVTRMSDTVAIGRSLDLTSPLPSSFAEVLQHGSIADQQRVLGLIARKFHPDYLPALQIALAHEAPVVRVQAAAVAAHVRVSVSRFVAQTLDDVSAPGIEPAAGLRAVREIRNCLRSGLLDERERVRVEGLVAGLETRCIADIDHQGPRTVRPDAAALDAYEAHLLMSNRFADFRSLRRHLRRHLFGRYVLRRAQWVRRSIPASGTTA
jgi:hypothetical protein